MKLSDFLTGRPTPAEVAGERTNVQAELAALRGDLTRLTDAMAGDFGGADQTKREAELARLLAREKTLAAVLAKLDAEALLAARRQRLADYEAGAQRAADLERQRRALEPDVVAARLAYERVAAEYRDLAQRALSAASFVTSSPQDWPQADRVALQPDVIELRRRYGLYSDAEADSQQRAHALALERLAQLEKGQVTR
jgi:hypothetical protein